MTEEDDRGEGRKMKRLSCGEWRVRQEQLLGADTKTRSGKGGLHRLKGFGMPNPYAASIPRVFPGLIYRTPLGFFADGDIGICLALAFVQDARPVGTLRI